MKLIRCALVLLLNVSLTLADINPNFLDYPLEIIDYLLENHFGTFECIFWDIAQNSDVLSELMKSPTLQYVTKYVVQGSYRSKLLPKNPSLLVIHPGNIYELAPHIKSQDIYRFLFTINPSTKVFVFWNIDDVNVFPQMQWVLFQCKFNNVVFFDTKKTTVILNSLARHSVIEDDVKPYPKNSLKWLKDQLRGSTIFYNRGENNAKYHPKHKWVMVTAKYLNGKALEYRKTEDGPTGADIFIERSVALATMDEHFRMFFEKTPAVGRVVVPRGRSLNAVEIMVLPFDWQVWTMLVVILVSAEVAKRFMPDVFQNDPVMLVVCGFERYNLHHAGRSERIVLQSLIVLMFFITNAFETKIVSLMVDRPSAPTAQKLKDFDKYGLKFRSELDKNPNGVNNSITGKYLVNGPRIELWETIPGFAKYINQDMADLVPKVSYDFERDQSWFVVLDERFLSNSILIHRCGFRSPYMQIFRFTHDALDESGIMRLWWRQASDKFWLETWGLRRPRGKIEKGKFLTFSDLLLAWIILAIGSCVSFVALIAEVLRKKFRSKPKAKQSLLIIMFKMVK
ncbi:uncharacterized protein LOC119770736 isoform X2 [Culex quinquefasciatus]|uniref:uncharacterized protein LOC119770736 isoform X2 n=1 Tax=Culex quinquefasciatus TaxID=7176 RepID=UPI0018E2D3A0|nr:uncharacterized protein LOC119770736 isoform X2 [Culex quinquefasciatus]